MPLSALAKHHGRLKVKVAHRVVGKPRGTSLAWLYIRRL